MYIRFFSLIAFLFFLNLENVNAHEDKLEMAPLKIENPPLILDKYYPPQSNDWVDVMNDMAEGFKGTWTDAKQGDWENALKNAEILETAFNKAFEMSSIIWQKNYFTDDFVSAFKEAVRVKNMNKMDEISKKLTDSCKKCHEEQSLNVWLKYYWKDIDTIEMQDPVIGRKLNFRKYKYLLVNSFYSLINESRQGDKKTTVKEGKEFINRYQGLNESCTKCHDDKQVEYFFVGGKVKQAIDTLSEELNRETPDNSVIVKATGIVRSEGCKKCHLTHSVAISLKERQEH